MPILNWFCQCKLVLWRLRTRNYHRHKHHSQFSLYVLETSVEVQLLKGFSLISLRKEGNQTDSRMRAASKRCGIEITSISRPIKSSDFVEFDLILAMDKQNRERGYMEAFNRWKFRDPLPEDAHKKVRLICSYCKKHDETEVPDPCYGGPEGFKKVLDMLEDACESLLENILAENKHIQES
ncbi:putative low molecular weight protein-tyrosine-phosphatase slr0328 isoform X5 [Trifolium pratense]|uniref:putative low molecular weight protein-tyrosine-phosphatase slr0328 isoform X5 n=1 Tax=Trifolium pratense TaxID=57577 RepID=UPI001E69783C|nr:putative low molecular weight protein-tyrosine-phosphatase slr0328 isoform X5 [Trifolium pratense]XP_045796358.1 putative low molecular weight protein-tyrosine-phosphatase slr0328 isoform X5 [Trifolium pratense]